MNAASFPLAVCNSSQLNCPVLRITEAGYTRKIKSVSQFSALSCDDGQRLLYAFATNFLLFIRLVFHTFLMVPKLLKVISFA